MTEQVIDIRDRIENEKSMTVPNSKGAVPERKVNIGKLNQVIVKLVKI